ncbi:serine hydrolase domain-containing protein [Flagellimonas nanhaiensis]|nr:serine hydrolase domain-containing protein [Allomuricauda nanhaiensis]
MRAGFLILLGFFGMSLVGCDKDDHNPIEPTLEVGVAGDTLLEPNMKKILEDYSIPGLASLTLDSNGVVEEVEIGIQSIDGENEIIQNSKWHLGSITKSMTATLVGILVDHGYLSWNTTIGDVASEGYLEDYKDVTMVQLLSHTGGILAEDYPVDPSDTRDVSEIRQEWALAVLNQPQGQIGTFSYSNNSYVVAGVMLELITQTSWEELMETFLLAPLGMTQTGFGAPGKNGNAHEPWGHHLEGGEWSPKNPTDIFSDNPMALGPGGTVHTTLNDLTKYIDLHLGESSIINASTLEMLHTEVNDSGYALGWNINENGIFHSGSNTNWFAQLYIDLDNNFVNFAVTNSYDLQGERSIPAIMETMRVMGTRYANSQ